LKVKGESTHGIILPSYFLLFLTSSYAHMETLNIRFYMSLLGPIMSLILQIHYLLSLNT
jgi:hypothetical protein